MRDLLESLDRIAEKENASQKQMFLKAIKRAKLQPSISKNEDGETEITVEKDNMAFMFYFDEADDPYSTGWAEGEVLEPGNIAWSGSGTDSNEEAVHIFNQWVKSDNIWG